QVENVIPGTYYIVVDGGEGDFVLTVGQMFSFVEEAVQASAIPAVFSLSENYPNPFNSSTVICFGVEESCRVTLDVYDMMGRKICNLVDAFHSPGQYETLFHMDDLPSGTYIYTIDTGNHYAARKMNLIK
ncbi:T9SS type A sorting domain-containing protein, partial [bacterium]|nr:T9SS type A sorting domain-containing protein [bacterium]